jgi:hypothetical protein
MVLRIAMLFVAGCLLAAAPASAVIPAGNLLQNPGAEDGPGATSDADVSPPPSWNPGPGFTAVQYGTGQLPDRSVSESINGLNNFFAGGPENQVGVSFGFQEVSLAAAAPEIDAGGQQMTLSGHLGGFAGQEDNMFVSVILTDENDQAVAGATIAGPTDAERGGRTGFRRRSQPVINFNGQPVIPPGARKATVVMQASRDSGSYNDAYADNLSLSFGADLGPPPEFKETASVAPVSGFILVRDRGTGRFRPLQAGEELSLDSEVDATRGEVNVTTAANASGELQTGAFGGGAFKVDQVGGANPVTELAMTRGTPGVCRIGRARTAARRIRRLSGNARGRFRTRGRHSSATVRGTVWSVEDRCNGTLTRVRQGTVLVRDFAKRKNVVLRRGRSYLAKPRRRR